MTTRAGYWPIRVDLQQVYVGAGELLLSGCPHLTRCVRDNPLALLQRRWQSSQPSLEFTLKGGRDQCVELRLLLLDLSLQRYICRHRGLSFTS